MQQVRSGIKSESEAVTLAAGRMALGTLSSRILGLFRDILLTSLFSRNVTDAFVVAFRLPNLFRRVLGEGSIAAAFVPLYSGHRMQPALAKAFARVAGFALLASAAALTVLAIVMMRPLLAHLVTGPEFALDSAQFEFTLWLGRLIFGYFFLVTSYAFVSAIAQAHGRFFWPAVAPALFNLLLIISMFMPSLRVSGDQLAWGVLAGGLTQNIMAIWAVGPELRDIFRSAPMPEALRIEVRVEVRRFFRNLVPAIAGLSGGQAVALLNIYFASQLAAGALSFIYLGDRLLELPLSLVAVSLGSALLPTLSRYWIEKKHVDFVENFFAQAEVLFFLLLPCAIGLWFLAEPIVRVLFQHGLFRESEVMMTTLVIQINAIILIFLGFSRLMLAGLHAARSLWAGASLSFASLGFHFFVARYLLEQEASLKQLMLATLFTSIATSIGLGLLLMFSLRRHFYQSNEVFSVARGLLSMAKPLLVFVARLTPPVVILVLVLIGAKRLWLDEMGVGFNLGVALATAILAGAASYLATGRFCRAGFFKARHGQ